MLTSTEIYNFLVTAEEKPLAIPPPGPELPPPPLPPTPGLGADNHIEDLRVRLQALIGPAVKRASAEITDADVERVFGKELGEIDPEAEPLDPEWEQILLNIVGDEPKSVEHKSYKNVGTAADSPHSLSRKRHPA